MTTTIEIPSRKLILADGEEYAGVLRVPNMPDCDLILMREADKKMSWKDMMKWAEDCGGELPDRREGRILWANLGHLFENAWYWLREQHASDPNVAWIQGFENGTQDWHRKGIKLRARAIRRSVIQ